MKKKKTTQNHQMCPRAPGPKVERAFHHTTCARGNADRQRKTSIMSHRDQQSWLPSKSQSQGRRPEKPTKPMSKPGVSSYNGMRASRRARLLNALGGKNKSTIVGVKRSSQSLYDFEADKSYEDKDISARVDNIMETLKPSYEILSKNGKYNFSIQKTKLYWQD